MKLYATTTSERASKGQGGNKELVISLKWENEYKERYEVAQVIFTNTENGYNISFFDSEDMGTPRTLKETKVKNQKGERIGGEDRQFKEWPVNGA